MTTAARPTFDPAKGGSGIREKDKAKLSKQVSSRDLPSHLTLKQRAPGQDTIDEVNERDLRSELEERERLAQLERSRGDLSKYVPSLEQATQIRLALKSERNKEREAEREALLDGSATNISEQSHLGINIVNARKMAQLDADEDFGSDEFSESDFEDTDEEGDDPAELRAELNRIKQERLEEELKKEQEQREKDDLIRSSRYGSESLADGFSIKRRWDDDVPFKNCARGDLEPKRKLYVNDTLRQEFHKKFMDKYIK